MSELLNPEASSDERPAALQCLLCEIPIGSYEGRNPLCGECREKAIRYPVPRWLRLFGAFIVLLLLFSLYKLPGTLSTAIHEKRAMVAMNAHRYKTAQRELEQAVRREPGFIDAQCRLLIAAYHNDDIEAMKRAYLALENKKIDNDGLFAQTTETIELAAHYLPSDSLRAFLQGVADPSETLSEAQVLGFLERNASDPMGRLLLATVQGREKRYPAADSTLRQLLSDEPGYSSALQSMVAVKREEGQTDSALVFAERLLDLNRESASAYGVLARVLLKQKKDAAALATVQEGLRIDPSDGYCLASLSLVYHFTGKLRERDALIEKAKADSASASSFSYVSDVVSGKEIFRN
ncbi:tetratricopeptide repeat protein [Flaviaesturariibacter terrae]